MRVEIPEPDVVVDGVLDESVAVNADLEVDLLSGFLHRFRFGRDVVLLHDIQGS